MATEQAADAIVITDRSGTIQYVNQAFTSITGYTSEEAIGQNPRIMKSGSQSPDFYADLWRTISSGRAWQGTLINRRKDGTLYDEEMQVTPVRDALGQIVSFFAIKRDVTQQRAAEEMQRLAAAIVEGSEDAIASYTPETEVLTWNRGAEAIFGIPAEQAIGSKVSALLSRQGNSDFENFNREILAGKTISQRKGTCLRNDGKAIHISVSGSPLRNSSGEVVAVAAILRDVSEREESAEMRALLASIVDSSVNAICSTTLDGTILSWNKSAADLFGYSRAEVVGQKISMLACRDCPDDAGRTMARIQGGGMSHYESIWRAKDRSPIDVAVTVSSIRSADGDERGKSLIIRDIRDQVQTEKALRESEAKFREAFEKAPFGMCLGGREGRLLRANSALCRMLGYSETELLGMTSAELTHPEDRIATGLAVESVSTNSGPYAELEKRYLHKSGRVVWARTRVSLIENSASGEPRFLGQVEDITAGKRAEEELRQSEERFHIMADGCPSAMWVTDATGGIQFINRKFRELFQATLEQMQGTKWQMMLHPDDAPRYLAVLRNAVREQIPFRAEVRVKRADGEWRWMESYAEPRFSAEGEYLGHVGLTPDITDAKNAQEAVRRTQDGYRMLAHAVESSGECISITDVQDRIMYVNSAFLRTYGYEEGELIGRHISIVRSDRTALETQREILPSTLEGSWNGEVWNRAKDGREFPVALNTSVVFDENGKRIALVGFAHDITERRRAEEALRQSEAKFRKLAENIREVFFVMDPVTYRVLYVSPAYEKLWGRSREDLYRNTKGWREAIHPDDRQRVAQTIPRQVAGESMDLEFRIRVGGVEKWIRSKSSPVFDETGRLIRIVGISEEITERKRYETELVKARDGADAANRAKSCFLANMSHEIRTPMNGVIGMLQLLNETELTEEQRQYAAVAQDSGRVLLKLIDDILDLSRVEARKITLEHLDFDLGDTIGGVVQLMEPQANAKGLQILLNVSAAIPEPLCGDALRLRQVITNLLANAIKFTDSGSVKLNAMLEDQNERAVRLRFEVIDSGIGIGPDEIERIFLPFSQADSSTTRKYGGTGLGLAICKQLVEMMGGFIQVESEVGKGSKISFTASFTRAADLREGVGQQASADQEPTLAATTQHAGRVLVVEDNTTNRFVALALLKKLGYAATAVNDGAEAVEAVEAGGIDLVLMDCHMPVMDGFQATRHIRNSKHPSVPIIALTADAMADDRARCLREGMNDHLAKPVELRPLQQILAKWLPETEPAPPNSGDSDLCRLWEATENPPVAAGSVV